jgi:hypothetical protein
MEGGVPGGGLVLSVECHVDDVASDHAMVSENRLKLFIERHNARWLIHVYDADQPIGISTTQRDTTPAGEDHRRAIGSG